MAPRKTSMQPMSTDEIDDDIPPDIYRKGWVGWNVCVEDDIP